MRQFGSYLPLAIDTLEELLSVREDRSERTKIVRVVMKKSIVVLLRSFEITPESIWAESVLKN